MQQSSLSSCIQIQTERNLNSCVLPFLKAVFQFTPTCNVCCCCCCSVCWLFPARFNYVCVQNRCVKYYVTFQSNETTSEASMECEAWKASKVERSVDDAFNDCVRVQVTTHLESANVQWPVGKMPAWARLIFTRDIRHNCIIHFFITFSIYFLFSFIYMLCTFTISICVFIAITITNDIYLKFVIARIKIIALLQFCCSFPKQKLSRLFSI